MNSSAVLHTLRPGLRVSEPRNFIIIPDTLSPMVAWRLWWWTGVALAWCPWAPVVLVVRVVVVVVVVVTGVRLAVRRPPSSLVLRLGRAVARVARTVRGAERRMRGMVVELEG